MTQHSSDSTSSRFVRGPATVSLYVLLALLTSGYGMIGPLMPFLRADLGLSYTEGSYHSVALSLGTTATGLAGRFLQRALGRRGLVLATLWTMVGGLVLMCLARHISVSMVGAALLGASIALAVGVAPAVMSERHGAAMGVAMAEANLIAYIGIFLVPGIVSLTNQAFGWRWSFALPVLIYAIYWAFSRHIDYGMVREQVAGQSEARLPMAYWWHWLFLGFGVASEFSMVIWGASYLESETNLSRDLALWSSMIFPAGMIIGRTLGIVLLRRFSAAVLVPVALVVAGLGLLPFLSARDPLTGMAGLLLTGVGMANFYPLGITLAMVAAGAARDAAAARASLASGIASLFAPLVLGAIADRSGMGVAFAIIPAFLLMAGLAHLAGLRATKAAGLSASQS